MNIVQIAGNLGADPETRFTASGQKVTTLRVASNVRKSGKDETVWWRVTIWGDRFEKMMPYLKKGSSVIVIGTLNKPEIWTDKEGRPQVSLEMVAEMLMFSPFGKSDRANQEQPAAGQSHQTHQTGHQMSESAGEYSMGSGFGGGSYGGGNQGQGQGQGGYQGQGQSNKQSQHDDEQPPF